MPSGTSTRGVDHDGERIIGSGTSRTIAGERFVRIRVQAIAASGTCGGTIITDDPFLLVADGLPLGPENSHVQLLDNGEGVELIWGYRIPADVAELVLDVGVSDGLISSHPIEIPSALP